MNNFDDRIVWNEMNQERMIQNFCAPYSAPLKGYHFAYNPDDTRQQ